MKTRILKKINKRVRIIKNDKGMFDVQVRNQIGFNTKKFDEWHSVKSFAMLKKAIDKKNVHIVMVLMRDLGYRNEFVKRRVKKKKHKL